MPFDENLKLLGDKMVAAGHTLSKESDGTYTLPDVDGSHFAPSCSVCYESCGCYMCVEVEDYNCPPCPGQEEMERREKDARREHYLELKAEFDPEIR